MPVLIIHGHFYQPPRENPWSGIVEPQPSAAPFHDWNERIHFECYRPNAFVRVSAGESTEEQFINNYELLSFNFGPTLLSWLEQHHSYTYERIREADRVSRSRNDGHGNGIAQAYGHAILPLCNQRDLRTQIRWGMADFQHRFQREAEAMWLPETACNDRVMSALIDEGLRYVILAPQQARRLSAGRGTGRIEPDKSAETIDPSAAYLYRVRDNRNESIAVFFYDGPTSRAIAFEKLLRSSREFVEALVRSTGEKKMINLATDGETYGHHFKFGDLCLAHALTEEAPARGFNITNYGNYLDQHPPKLEVDIDNGPDGEGTSWSCQHGLGRWTRDCGCHTGGEAVWNQTWRGPLRQALDFLRDENVGHFENTRDVLFIDPWRTRDDSIALILDKQYSREEFLLDHAGRWLSGEAQQRALAYLELQRMLLLMYTSCGWFFNDISGIETIQILKYAERASDLMEQLDLPSVRDQFLKILSEAKSNRAEMGTGADVYRQFVEPLNPNFQRSRSSEPVAVGSG
jgi:alpha-amylase/alpha-mannosidase (GH57 family)